MFDDIQIFIFFFLENEMIIINQNSWKLDFSKATRKKNDSLLGSKGMPSEIKTITQTIASWIRFDDFQQKYFCELLGKVSRKLFYSCMHNMHTFTFNGFVQREPLFPRLNDATFHLLSTLKIIRCHSINRIKSRKRKNALRLKIQIQIERI